ncbi:hypothetical protein KCO_13407 [Pectobacterium brasiliense ICMP 19477]|nr:hypothetical protein KCO_13407 [Pectobacterium brasiliense ICMP 19477]
MTCPYSQICASRPAPWASAFRRNSIQLIEKIKIFFGALAPALFSTGGADGHLRGGGRGPLPKTAYTGKIGSADTGGLVIYLGDYIQGNYHVDNYLFKLF